jgi:hypothetical protein
LGVDVDEESLERFGVDVEDFLDLLGVDTVEELLAFDGENQFLILCVLSTIGTSRQLP